MPHEKFTERASKALQLANQEAQRLGHDFIGSEHVLLGLLRERYGIASTVLSSQGLHMRRLRHEALLLTPPDPNMTVSLGKLPANDEAKQTIEQSMQEASILQHDYIGTEHILLGLLRQSESNAATILNRLDFKLDDISREVMTLIDTDFLTRQRPPSPSETPPKSNNPIRVLDASANRATEGLRVVEDYVRFVLNDEHLTSECKTIRHDLGQLIAQFDLSVRANARDTEHDVGTAITTTTETTRPSIESVFQSNFERTKQSLRSLEEFTKVGSPELASKFETLRYQLYTLEKALITTQTSSSRLDGVTLCALIDGQETPEAFTKLVEKIIADGVGMIQLRDKQLETRQLVERAKLLKQHAGKTLVIINDRADIAAAASADGVHLGQDDLDLKSARAILGPRKLIGVSTHSIKQARTAVLDGANYLGAGPTFPSKTKSFDNFPGLDYLRQVATEITLPTFAIGGITVDNLPQVLETGTSRIAVSSAASDAAKLLSLLKSHASN